MRPSSSCWEHRHSRRFGSIEQMTHIWPDLLALRCAFARHVRFVALGSGSDDRPRPGGLVGSRLRSGSARRDWPRANRHRPSPGVIHPRATVIYGAREHDRLEAGLDGHQRTPTAPTRSGYAAIALKSSAPADDRDTLGRQTSPTVSRPIGCDGDFGNSPGMCRNRQGDASLARNATQGPRTP